jgi:glycosyltransferase involved in cell wall biosynthesis
VSIPDQPLVSVIMPAFNCGSYIKIAIDSILNQTYRNFELLMADDCSKDNTKSIIDSYKDPRIKTFHNEVNLGYLKASNKLFKQCTGDYITFQDADDYSDVQRFEKMLAFLQLHPETDCLGSNVIKVDNTGTEFHKTSFPEKDTDIRKMFGDYKVVFTGSALMLTKKLLERTGIYNEYFDRVGAEDIYMYSHILNHTKVANLPEALYYYRANPNSVTSTHKNPKAFVTGDLVIRYYKRRLNGETDHIQSGDWKKADAYVRYLLAMRKLNESIGSALGAFSIASLRSPLMLPVFLKEFLSKLKYRLTH